MKKTIFYVIMLSALCTSCSKEESKEISLSPATLQLNAGNRCQVSVLNDKSSYNWSVGDEFVATVSSSGLVSAMHVGSTYVTASSGNKKGTCEVVVSPLSDLYPTPYLAWGKSKSAVRSKLGTPNDDGDSYLGYIVSSTLGIVAMYIFTNNKLSSINVLLNLNNLNSLKTYLNERYNLIHYQDGVYYYINATDVSKCTLSVSMRYQKINSLECYTVTYIDGSQFNAPQRHSSLTPEISIPSNVEYLFNHL